MTYGDAIDGLRNRWVHELRIILQQIVVEITVEAVIVFGV